MIFDIERHARTGLDQNTPAPGGPGDPPRWTTGAKTAVGTSASEASRVWFTISDGILNEIYFPSIDQANTRSLRFVIADAHSFVSDEESDAEHQVRQIAPSVPGFEISTHCRRDRYRLQKQVFTDPERDVLVLNVEFEPKDQNLRLYVLFDPHIGDSGAKNDGWVGKYKDIPMLFARREQTAMALASSSGFGAMSVRFGLRAADDPRIVNTVRVIDASVKEKISNGPVWRRYTDDGYGEHPDGSPFQHTGQGRGWPLLAGERAHYEIARGNFAEAEKLRETIAAQTSECGLLPEQVWDAEDIPAKHLFNGRPTGSGIPLVWAHAEYIKLLRSLKERRIWDLPPQPVERYVRQKKTAPFQIWTFKQQRSVIRRGKNLRIDCLSAAKIRWSDDHWKTKQETETKDSGLGMHYAMLNTAEFKKDSRVVFTFFWPEARKWEGRDFTVGVI